MAILAQCAELQCYDTVVGAWGNSTAGADAYRRCGVYLGSIDPNAYLHKSLSAAKTTLGLTGRNNGTSRWTLSTTPFFGFAKAGALKLGISNTLTTGLLRLVKWDGASYVTLATSAVPPTDSVRYRLDAYLENYGVAARVRVWITYYQTSTVPQLVIDFTGDVTSPACVDVDGLWLTAMNKLTFTTDTKWQNVVASDEPTLRMELATLELTADTLNEWDSGTYAEIKAVDPDTAKFIETSAALKRYLGVLSDLPSTLLTPLSVNEIAYAALGTSGPTKLDLGIKSGGIESYGPDQILGLAYQAFWRLMPVDPTDGLPWTVAKVNALDMGVKSIA